MYIVAYWETRLIKYKKHSITKRWVYKHLGSYKNACKVLGIEESLWLSWGNVKVPAPYSCRLILSNWGKDYIGARFVSIEDALIIFKKPHILKEHLRLKDEEINNTVLLPEAQSYFMIRHFGKFMRVFKGKDLTT